MFKMILAVSASLLTLISAATAQPRGEMLMAADELGLTEDQVNRLDDLMLQHQKEMIRKKAAMMEARLDLKAMMREAKVDEKTALAKQDSISKIKADIASAKLKHKLAMRGVLTSEQLDKWLKMKRKHEGFGKHGSKKHRGPCMQGPPPGMGPGMGMGWGPGPEMK